MSYFSKLLFASLFIPMTLCAQQSTIDSLRRVYDSEIDDSTRVRVTRQLAAKYRILKPDSAYYFARQLIKRAKKMTYITAEHVGYQEVGLFYYIRQQFDSSVWYLNKALTMAGELGDSARVSTYQGNMAMIYGRRGQYDEALKNLFPRLKYTEEHDLLESQSKTLNNIAYIYHRMQRYQDALNYNHKALEVKKALNNEMSILETYGNLGANFTSLNNKDSAFFYHKKALALSEKLGVETKLASILVNIATYHADERQFNFDSAKWYAERALAYGNKYENLGTIARIYSCLGNIHYLTKQYEVAIKMHRKAKEFYEGRKIEEGLQGTLYAIAVNLNHLGRYKEAYHTLLESRAVHDSVFNRQGTEVVSELKVKYETEKKEQEIAIKNAELSVRTLALSRQQLLRNIAISGLVVIAVVALLLYWNFRIKSSSNKTISAKNRQLEKAVTEREALIKEIHHRVKNNLQVIASLLYLQSDESENASVKKLLEEGQGRVRSMALIHQKLYENEDLKSIPFEEYLKELISEIQRSFGPKAEKVRLEVRAKDVFFDVDTAVPLGLIVNELSTNAFKYAYSRQLEGFLKIQLTNEQDNVYSLHVSDNGGGIPDDKLDTANSQSLGLKLTKMLSSQLEGEYSFDNTQGTTFNLRFSA